MLLTNHISKKISYTMLESDIITSDQREIYIYCFNYIFDLIFYIISFLLISLLLNRFLIGCLCMLTVIPFRSFAGGYHASKQSVCTLLSYGSFVCSLIISSIFAPLYSTLWLVIFISECILICFLAPIDTPNKRLNKDERTQLKKFCLCFAIALFLIFFIFFYLDYQMCYGTMAICGIIPTVSVMIGDILNKRKEQKNVTENSNM